MLWVTDSMEPVGLGKAITEIKNPRGPYLTTEQMSVGMGWSKPGDWQGQLREALGDPGKEEEE
jgi:hypothetical protein